MYDTHMYQPYWLISGSIRADGTLARNPSSISTFFQQGIQFPLFLQFPHLYSSTRMNSRDNIVSEVAACQGLASLAGGGTRNQPWVN